MIIVTDIAILFSDLVSLIVPLQTWNVKYYGLKSLLKVTYVASASADELSIPAASCMLLHFIATSSDWIITCPPFCTYSYTYIIVR